MQAKIISRTRTNTTEEHATDPNQTGTETKVTFRIQLDDMPTLSPIRFYRGPSIGWVPNYVTVDETLTTGYGDDDISHYRIVRAQGFLLKKDGSVGKLATEDSYRIYATREDPMPAALAEAIAQVVPAFQKGILP